ncbi:MAG: G/U mismatch-specific DNA glycosylase [Gemmatimonadales bacterium]
MDSFFSAARATPEPRRPSRTELLAAAGRTVPDLIAPRLKVLFCGINPGLYSAATRHHFARPGNRFWPALHAGGFTDRVLAPWEERLLLPAGYGITNLVARATAAAAELDPAELNAGRRRLERKVGRYAPQWVAVLGVGAYRTAFGRRRAALGVQSDTLGSAGLWVLPNPSGLNANHQIADLARLFRELHESVAGNRR